MVLTEHGKELLTYSRKKVHQKGKKVMVPLAPVQSSAPITEPKTTQCIQNIPPVHTSCVHNKSNIYPISQLVPNTEFNDLDIPKAFRIAKHSCTSHSITRYMSHGKLSKKHNAFIFKLSNLFVPRNIQEALDGPNWKSAVMEKMNALRKSGTWEVVALPKD